MISPAGFGSRRFSEKLTSLYYPEMPARGKEEEGGRFSRKSDYLKLRRRLCFRVTLP
jgi:hypothetical protein